MSSTISKEITLTGYYREIKINEPFSKDDTDANLIKKLDSLNGRSTRIWRKIDIINGWVRASGWELCNDGAETLQEESSVGENRHVSKKFHIRGAKVYTLPEFECLKCSVLTIGLPIFTVIRKIFYSIIVSVPLKIISILGGRCKLSQSVEWRGLMPLRALVGVVAHPIISSLGLIYGLSNYFNKLNGDLERWINGHTDLDLETKSSARREKEAPYLALCQQPLFKFKSLEIPPRVVNVSTLTGDEQRLAFRALMGCGLYSVRPVVTHLS